MNRIAIYGAGGFGREVKMLIDQINLIKGQYDLIGFYDDDLRIGTKVNGLRVLGGMNELNNFQEPLGVVFAIGNPITKKRIIQNLSKLNVTYPILIHPSCWVGNDSVDIGDGSIICAGTVITCNIKIGKHVILNLCCTVGHDTNIGDYSSFMPSVNISGEVEISEAVYCGTGAKIINRVSIGENTIIGAGAVVSKNIPPNCTAVGVPAKPIKFHNVG